MCENNKEVGNATQLICIVKKKLNEKNSAVGSTAQLIHSLTKKLKQNNNTVGNAAQLIHSVKKKYNDNAERNAALFQSQKNLVDSQRNKVQKLCSRHESSRKYIQEQL